MMGYRLGYHVACGLVELDIFIRYGHRDRGRIPAIRATLIDVIGGYPLQSAEDAHYLYSIGARLRRVWPERELLDSQTMQYAADTYSADAAPAALAIMGGFEGRSFPQTLSSMLTRLNGKDRRIVAHSPEPSRMRAAA
jgi:hypothetical protein